MIYCDLPIQPRDPARPFIYPFVFEEGAPLQRAWKALSLRDLATNPDFHIAVEPSRIIPYAGTRIVGVSDFSTRNITIDVLEEVYFHYVFRPGGGIKCAMFFSEDGRILDISTMAALPEQISSLVANARHRGEGILCGDRFTDGNMCHVAFDHVARAITASKVLEESPSAYLYDTSWNWAKAFTAEIFPDGRYLKENTTYHFSRLYLFSDAFDGPIQHPEIVHSPLALQEYKKFQKSINSVREPGTRLYLNRNKNARRSLENEGHLEEALGRVGFDSIDFGELSFDEQILLAKKANVIAAPHGAALTNLLACDPGTLVIEFFNSRYGGTRAYQRFSNAFDLEYIRQELSGEETPEQLEEILSICLSREQFLYP